MRRRWPAVLAGTATMRSRQCRVAQGDSYGCLPAKDRACRQLALFDGLHRERVALEGGLRTAKHPIDLFPKVFDLLG